MGKRLERGGWCLGNGFGVGAVAVAGQQEGKGEREREEKKKLREEDGKRDGSGMDRFLCEFECHGYE